MNRNLRLFSLVVLGLPYFASCATAPPPFGTSYEAYRGFKARTFVGTSEDVRPAVIASLRDQGFEVYPDAEDRTYIIAHRGMAASVQEEASEGELQTEVIKHKHSQASLLIIYCLSTTEERCALA